MGDARRLEARVIRFVSGDDERRVEVRDGPGGLRMVVDGVSFDMDVREIAPGSFEMRRDGGREVFYCVRDGDCVHLSWRGAVHRLELLQEGSRAAHRHSGGGLEAPMPGKVIALKAAVGQAVTKGEEILIVEAMKMENAIRAPRDGTVKAIAVKVGDMVTPGAVLVELE
jgi:3-methylcrotonyl-CoA carboxylase alpha subunit